MKFDLYQDGVWKMTIQSVGTVMQDDFVVLPKRFVKGCSLSPESFVDLVGECQRETKTYQEAYEKAEEVHEQYFGTSKYSNYDSFRISKFNRQKI